MFLVPRIDCMAVFVASIAFFVVGFVIYGVAFNEFWVRHTLVAAGHLEAGPAAGMSLAHLEALWRAEYPSSGYVLPMVLGFLTNLVTVAVLAIVLERVNPRTMADGIATGLLLCLGFSLTGLALKWVYSPEPSPIIYVDALHVLLGVGIASAVLMLFKRRKDNTQEEETVTPES